MGIRDGLNSLMEGLVNEWIIVPFAENIGHDTPVTEIQDGTQIELMYLNALIPFELRHIGQTFLIRFLCMELAVQEVVGYCGFLTCLVQPWLLYFTVDRISLARQIRSTLLSLTWMP